MRTTSLIFATAILIALSGCRTYSGEISDHYDGDMFLNPWNPQKKSLLDLIRWKLGSDPEEWPEWIENNPDIKIPRAYEEGNVEVTFINHASFLLSIEGVNILIDPMWSERTSPFTWLGPKRRRDPGLVFEELPQIHYVLITHNHYDHLDLDTLRRIEAAFQAKVFVPLGDRSWLIEEGIQDVKEMDWWQSVALNSEIKLHFLPSQHGSARGLFDRNQSLWGAFALEFKGKIIYVAGDTGYGPHFKWAAERLPPVELALLPIGAYEPRWLVEYLHLNPADSVKAAKDLKARYAVAKHFGCWRLTDEGFEQPEKDLLKALKDVSHMTAPFLIPEVGGTYRYRFE